MGTEGGGLLTSGLRLPTFLFPLRRYVLDLPAMQRIQGAKVLLSGLQGLGAEVAKNLVLMGVGSLTLHDPQPACWSDLAAQVRVVGRGVLRVPRPGWGWRPREISLLKAEWVSV